MLQLDPFPSHFYAIVDSSAGHEPVALAEQMIRGGARLLQLRLKSAGGAEMLDAARKIERMCREANALLIVNDRLDVAILAGASGVHLGQDDLPLHAARRLAGPSMLIGISTHDLDQAVAAEAGGADYIGFGPIFPGGLKHNTVGKGLDALRAVRRAVKIPIVAIGGITEATLRSVLAAGADAAAIISDVLKSADITDKVCSIIAAAATL
jgi:thiamine-phosphate diphosphorylase